MNLVKCELCGSYYPWITHSHLKYRHGLEVIEYREMFPGRPLRAKGWERTRVEAIYKGRHLDKTSEELEEIARKISGNKVPWSHTIEAKRKISEANSGSTFSEEHKTKIGKGVEKYWKELSEKEKKRHLEKSIHSPEAFLASSKACRKLPSKPEVFMESS
ncbi:hypothetical protein LCGC14_0998700 [marine sediment metagenome]|uniref:Uncharacterized protein n=1 Tax=marine sediment metagenome TaxID=412755 RepID=A0A0F9R9W7_9ZZZZ